MNRFLAQGFRAINNLWAILIVGGMWGARPSLWCTQREHLGGLPSLQPP